MVNSENIDAVRTCAKEVERLQSMLEQARQIGTGYFALYTSRYDAGNIVADRPLPKELCEGIRPVIVKYYENKLFEAERELRIAAERLAR